MKVSPTLTCRAHRNCLNVALYRDPLGRPACSEHETRWPDCKVCSWALSLDGHCRNQDCDRYDTTDDQPEFDAAYAGYLEGER